ncbi:hypothetical protein MLPF_1458 [Mycobacterium lepromatosis]|nr:hypothetical protein MLPF_1458 [Mycobacterium lepromatosis]
MSCSLSTSTPGGFCFGTGTGLLSCESATLAYSPIKLYL